MRPRRLELIGNRRLDKDAYDYKCGSTIDNTPADQSSPSKAIEISLGELIMNKYAQKAMVCDPALVVSCSPVPPILFHYFAA